MAPSDRIESDGGSSSDPSDPLLGTSIGRFRVERFIGQGGMGAVYELLHPGIHKRMALKVLHEDYAERRDVVQRFFDEARAVNIIGHPNIVDITDFGHLDDGRPFIIMELLQGQTLEDYLEERGPLAESEVLRLVSQIGAGLEAAHDAGIVHRDLKPENIFIVQRPGQEDHIKILDFGIAKLKSLPTDDDMTETGVVLGTPTYMSPEQASGKSRDSDARSDIYSLGIMVFEMLSGTPPFAGESFPELILKHLNQPPPPLTTADGPSRFSSVVERALEKRPDERFGSVAQMLLAMQSSAPDATESDDTLQGVPAAPMQGVTSSGKTLAYPPVTGAAASEPSAPVDRTLGYDEDQGHDAVPVAPVAPERSSTASLPSHTRSPSSAFPLRPVLLAGSALFTLVAVVVLITRGGSSDDEPRPRPAPPRPLASTAVDAAIDVPVPVLPDAGAVTADAAPPTEPPAEHATPRGRGTVKVLASPWARVFVDGKPSGQTPVELRLPAGTHKIRLYNEDSGSSRFHRVTVQKGKKITIREVWE